MSSWIYLPLFVSLSSLCILLIICHTGMSNRITDKQADCSERPPETWRCCSKSETKLPGSQTAAHFTTRLTISLLRFLLFLIYGLHLAVFFFLNIFLLYYMFLEYLGHVYWAKQCAAHKNRSAMQINPKGQSQRQKGTSTVDWQRLNSRQELLYMY